MKRKCGILLPVFSLPSKYGIGTLGKAAFEFIDFLSESKITMWQVLPLGPTGFGDSPYQSFSAFAGNEYFIDLDELVVNGLLKDEEIAALNIENDKQRIDYGNLFLTRFEILEKAAQRFFAAPSADYDLFLNENKDWVVDYAAYMAIKKTFNMSSWLDWPEEYRLKERHVIDTFINDNQDLINHYLFCQYQFYKQWNTLRQYAKKKKIEIIGDIPFYVALDSSDAWGNKELFVLDSNGFPVEVAGVPPDYFSETGQLWGNPVYDWDKKQKELYKWWRSRIRVSSGLYDYLRIDHFRGFDSYWTVPAGRPNAIEGRWKKGPGIRFIKYLKRSSKTLKLIAEDLGLLTPSVRRMLFESRLPGMKVLEFAFSSDKANEYLPEHYPKNCVCYTGTHDNEPLKQWLESMDDGTLVFYRSYMKNKGLDTSIDSVIRLGMSSKAHIFIAQLQDYLETGKESRINSPGVDEGNWQWRVNPESLTESLKNRLSDLVTKYNR